MGAISPDKVRQKQPITPDLRMPERVMSYLMARVRER
jgi:hypothetical protein